MDAQSLEGVEYGADVSGVVFYDCYAHREGGVVELLSAKIQIFGGRRR